MSIKLFLKKALHSFSHLVGGFSFWTMAIFCLALRLFVKYPLGPLLALITGCVWIWKNMSSIKAFFNKSV